MTDNRNGRPMSDREFVVVMTCIISFTLLVGYALWLAH